MKKPFSTRCAAVGLATAAVLMSACRTTEESEVKDTQVRTFEGELGMRPGVGYEGIFEDVRGVCVEHDGTEPLGNAQQVTYELALVENHRDLGLAMNVSSASQVKAAIPDSPATVSAKTKFMLGHSYTLNRYSVFLLAKVEVRNEASLLKNPRIKDSIKAELASQQADAVDRFRLQCGDAYLSGVTTGGEFFGVIEIETENAEQQAEVKRESAVAVAVEGIGEASNETSFEARLKRVTKNRNVKIWTYQRGGSGSGQVGLVDTVDAMITRIKRFPDFVAQGGNPSNYTATFQDYFTLQLPLPAEYRNGLLSAQDIMAELAGKQAELIDRRGDIEYILRHPNSFVGVNAAKITELQQLSRQQVSRMREIYNAARACYRNFRDCKVPEALATLPELNLPARKTTVAALQRDVVILKTKLQNINVDALYDGLWNPPDCYLEVLITDGAAKSKRVIRTNTDFNKPRCDELNKTFELPLGLIKESIKGLGITEETAQIQVRVLDDDPGTVDEVIGTHAKSYKQIIDASAVLDTLTGTYVTLGLEYEVR